MKLRATPINRLAKQTMLNRRLSLAALAAAALAGCSKGSDSFATSPNGPGSSPVENTPESLGNRVHGFTLGPLMARNVVYVFFDMQCPHCGALWNTMQPLAKQGGTKFIWIPVNMLGRASLAQGATILAEKDPVAAMTQHEVLLLNRQGGMSANADAMATHGDKVKANKQVLDGLGVTGVPHIVARHAQTQAVVTHTGALDTGGLTQLLGL